jgi:aldehyde dehydrogenase (NAD+)
MNISDVLANLRTQHFYIDGEWQAPTSESKLDVVNPATEKVFATISMGSRDDVDKATRAARTAFASYSLTSRAERLALLSRVLDVFSQRLDAFGEILTMEMGAPSNLARHAQAYSGVVHLEKTIEALARFDFETLSGSTMILREPIGVIGMITPWNWPINQIVCKVAPALAAGCTMVLKPSELAPLNALMFAQVLHDAGVPKGVVNVINGDGATVGDGIAAHPEIDMVSFTGSTRAGVSVAKTAADSVKRIHQELGGKSANIILPDADLEAAVTRGVLRCFNNSGQSCNAPTRMLVQKDQHERATSIAKAAATALIIGDPLAAATNLGPVISEAHFNRIQHLIEIGIREGATLVVGGTGRPDGLGAGYYVKPTIFANVHPDMTIAREEIFGPVLAILPYDDEEDAVRMANDTPYGLAAYIQSGDLMRARRIAARMQAGSVHINDPKGDDSAPFGGYKQSGNGREYGRWGLEECLETKAVLGYEVA